jgi:uncharacterized protein (TIGR02145 family)
MENSEKKSLISTGSSNLSKTEKLLSITQKILSEIKPKFESVRIGNQEWMTRNLDVDRFSNGDLIPHIELREEWEEACSNSQPAWCYYDNDPENGKKYGKLYNWFAVNDPRELAPIGWHVPSDDEWTSLDEFLGEDIAGHKMKSFEVWEEFVDEDGKIQNGNGNNSSGFNGLPSGYRYTWGSFNFIRNHAFFWSAAEGEVVNGWVRSLSINKSHAGRFSVSESVGASVRCIKDSSDSKWVQAVRAGNIKPYVPRGLKLK